MGRSFASSTAGKVQPSKEAWAEPEIEFVRPSDLIGERFDILSSWFGKSKKTNAPIGHATVYGHGILFTDYHLEDGTPVYVSRRIWLSRAMMDQLQGTPIGEYPLEGATLIKEDTTGAYAFVPMSILDNMPEKAEGNGNPF